MTSRTRRLLFFSVLLAVLTLPAEGLLLKALRAQGPDAVIKDWAASLNPADLQTAAGQIETYPFAYRKAIMGLVTPHRRSEIWRRHMARYVSTHALDDATVADIQAVSALATDTFFIDPTDEARQAVHELAERITDRIGRDDAEVLLYFLGPKDGTFASVQPLQVRVINSLRSIFTLEAFSGSCDCAMYQGCMSDRTYSCVNWTGCSTDSSWGCGWFWMDPCDGGCVR